MFKGCENLNRNFIFDILSKQETQIDRGAALHTIYNPHFERITKLKLRSEF